MEKVVIRPCARPYVLVIVLALICLVATIYRGDAIGTIVQVVIFSGVLAGLRSYSVVIDGDVISRHVFLMSWSLRKSDIKRVEPMVFISKASPAGLRIFMKEGRRTYRIGLNAFSGADARRVVGFFEGVG